MKYRHKLKISDVLVILVSILTISVVVWAIIRVNIHQIKHFTDIEIEGEDWSLDTAESSADEFELIVVELPDTQRMSVRYYPRNYILEQKLLEYMPENTHTESSINDVQVELVEDVYASPETEIVDYRYYYSDVEDIRFTEDDIYLLATLVTLEVGAESYECQKAVASVVINRMIVDNKSLSDVIYQRNLFSVAPKVASAAPFDECIQAATDVVENGTTVPRYVTYFRAGHYHDWGDRYVSWKQIDKTYFTYDIKLKDKWS